MEAIVFMSVSRPRAQLLPLLVLCGAIGLSAADPPACAQPAALSSNSQFELADTVQVDRADSAVLSQLERVKAHLADRQWDVAVETLRQLMAGAEGKLLALTDHRYVNLRDYVQLQLAALPPEALKLYRGRVDPLARRWYEEGVAGHNRRLLENVVEQAFASSFGDDALLALGEMALESGDPTCARWQFERIIPADPPPDQPRTWPSYPDTHLDLAGVRARLVLASILEGSLSRARGELTQFERLHGQARGRLGGQEVKYAEALRRLLHESTTWPQPEPGPDWPTFAGSPARNRAAPEPADVAEVAWRVPLPKVATAQSHAPRMAEGRDAPLSYHPLVAGDLVLLGTRAEVFALRAATGKPAWGSEAAAYRDQFEGMPAVSSDPPGTLGVPRFTATVHDGKLFAHMGSAVTSLPQESVAVVAPGYLVCLDLAAEGRLLWKVAPEASWAFDGSPVADAAGVYVAMRRNDIRPQAHVACFDAQTGQLRWRRFVCGAETPVRGMLHQNTHHLLSLCGRTLYLNTNLGAVCALRADDGRLLWVSLYPRARQGDLMSLAPHWQRELTPCLVDHGTLLVAPADSPRIFALDAGTGQIVWQTGTEGEDVVHLLGVTGEHLIASGSRLYWIGLKDADRGRIEHVWPDGPDKPGYGRGLLTAGSLLWPTREKIYVLDPKTAQPKKVIDLLPRGVTGGNLVVCGDRLLIATGTELIALGPRGRAKKHEPETVGQVFNLSEQVENLSYGTRQSFTSAPSRLQ